MLTNIQCVKASPLMDDLHLIMITIGKTYCVTLTKLCHQKAKSDFISHSTDTKITKSCRSIFYTEVY